MLWASLLLGALFKLNIKDISLNFILAILDPTTLRLMGIIVLVFLLSGILRKIESLKDMIDSLKKLVKDHRLILAFIPFFLGLLPIPSVALFSASIAKEVGESMNLKPEENTFVNLWFTHVLDFIWPLFPEMVLFCTLLEVDVREIVIVQFPLTLIAVIYGLIWEYKYLKRNTEFNKRENILFNTKKLFLSTWPILLFIFLAFFLKMNLLISLSIIVLSLILLNILLNRFKIKDIIEIIRKDVPLSTVFLIAGIMIFKRMLQVTGVIEDIPGFFTELGIHPLIILFIIPFLIGLLTGSTLAVVGITFPVLLSFIIQSGVVNLNYAMFAFVGGYVGHMLSPLHLCLVLTKDYFKADLGEVYKILIPPLSIIILTALVLVMVRTV